MLKLLCFELCLKLNIRSNSNKLNFDQLQNLLQYKYITSIGKFDVLKNVYIFVAFSSKMFSVFKIFIIIKNFQA
jgi:hypothetical protein